MDIFTGEVIVALIGLVGVFITAYVGHRSKLFERNLAKQEMELQAAALDFAGFMSHWDGVYSDLESLMNETEIDRFIILRAWNGVLDPKWTTSCFQMRQGKQEPISYMHVDLDQDYVEKLIKARQSDFIQFSVADEAPSLIKSIYEAEGVQSSLWMHLETLDGGNDTKAITYCSFASHTKGDLDDDTVTRCRLISSRLKGMAHVFRDPEDS